MSTKIYNGYKFKEPLSLDELHGFCIRLRDKVKPIAEDLYFQTFFRIYFEVLDKNQFGMYDEAMYFLSKEGGNLEFGIDRYLMKRMRHIKISEERDPDVDFEFSITILPLKSGEVLVLLYTEKGELRKAFATMPEIEEYHYQDQSDKPERISKKAWDKRRDDWQAALGGDGWGIPLEHGFNFTPYSERRLSFFMLDDERKKEILKLIPTPEERAKVIARNLHLEQWSNKNPIDKEITNSKDKNKIYEANMTSYWRYVDFRKTDVGNAEFEKIIQEIVPKLTLTKVETLRDIWTDIKFHPKVKKILKSKYKGKPYWYDYGK